MTDQELSEILAHPRIRSFVERVAEEAATRAIAQMLERKKANVTQQERPAAEGDVNYENAAAFIGCTIGSIRTYACTGALKRGKLRYTVTMESCLQLKRTFKPRPNGRTSGR